MRDNDRGKENCSARPEESEIGWFKMNGRFTDINYMNSSHSLGVICLMALFLGFPASAKDKGNFEYEQQPHQPADQ